MKHSARFALFASALVFNLSAGAEIYKWTDKDGGTHFSDMPPPQTEAETLNTPALPRPAPPDTRKNAAEDETETDKDSAESAPPASAIPAAAPARSLAERELEFRQRRAAAAKSRAKAEADAALADRRAQDCQRARAQHHALASSQRVARPTADGGRTFLDDDERDAEIARTQEFIDKICTGQAGN
jgi:hypothetical protein